MLQELLGVSLLKQSTPKDSGKLEIVDVKEQDVMR